VSQFIFRERKHGALAGQTLPEALQAGKTAAVLRAAEVFASDGAAPMPEPVLNALCLRFNVRVVA
jgi:hypothetical protein